MKRKRRRKINKPKETNYDRRIYLKVRCAVILAICAIVIGSIYWFLENFRITGVLVEGNEHYTSTQIQQIVMNKKLTDNSVVLSMLYRNKSITDIPFVERMDVSIVDKHNIKITVYEKALAGYIEYLGNYMYFDKDGIIIESSNVKTQGIPQVTGLKFDHVVLHSPLPVEKEDVFEDILDMTQLMDKYGICADRIYFDTTYHVTLYFNNVKVMLGTGDLLDEKIMQLPYILPNLEGKSGILHMENYSEATKNTTFEYD